MTRFGIPERVIDASRVRKRVEHGSRIYAPSANEARYRVVATDPVSRERIFVKCRT